MKGINVVVETNKGMKYEKLNIFCLIYLCAWALIPVFAYYTSGTIFRIIYAGVVGVWILTGIYNTKVKHGIDILSMLMFFLVMLIYWGFGYGDINFNDFVNYILLFGFAINANVYMSKLSSKSIRFLKIFFLVCLFLTTVTTINTLMTNVNASRYLTSSSVDETIRNSLQLLNVGSFDYIYGILIALFAIISNITQSKRHQRVAYLVLSVLIVVCILKANFTTAYVLLFASAALFIIPKSKSSYSKVMAGIIILVLVVIGPSLIELFIKALLEVTESIYSKNKLNSILDVINGSSSVGDTSVRFELMKMDLESFVKNPLFGVGGYYRTSIGTGIGQHSQVLDDIARYGILGATFLLYFVIRSIYHLWGELKEDGKRNPLLIPTMIFVAFSFLNPAFNDGILVCYFAVTPIMLHKERKEQ